MKRVLVIAAFLAALTPVGASAQMTDAQRAELVGQCLTNVAGVEEAALFANLMTAVLARDEAGAATFRTAIIARAREVGIAQCNQTEGWFATTWVGGALGYYIEATIARMFQEGVLWLRNLP